MFHTIVQERIATKEFETEQKQGNESRWMKIKAMEMRKAVLEEKLRVLEEELQMKKVDKENARLCSWALLGLMKHKGPMFCQSVNACSNFWRPRWEGVGVGVGVEMQVFDNVYAFFEIECHVQFWK